MAGLPAGQATEFPGIHRAVAEFIVLAIHSFKISIHLASVPAVISEIHREAHTCSAVPLSPEALRPRARTPPWEAAEDSVQ